MKVSPSHFNPFHAKACSTAGENFFKDNLETGGGDEGGRCGELGGGEIVLKSGQAEISISKQ